MYLHLAYNTIHVLHKVHLNEYTCHDTTTTQCTYVVSYAHNTTCMTCTQYHMYKMYTIPHVQRTTYTMFAQYHMYTAPPKLSTQGWVSFSFPLPAPHSTHEPKPSKKTQYCMYIISNDDHDNHPSLIALNRSVTVV